MKPGMHRYIPYFRTQVIAAAILSMALSCNKDIDGDRTSSETSVLDFSTTITANAESGTKAPIEGEKFPSSTTPYKVGMWVCEHEEDPARFAPALEGYGNLLASLLVEATTSGQYRDVWEFNYDGKFHKRLDIRRGSPVDIYAYYPYNEGKDFDPTAVPFTSGETDWMWAEKESLTSEEQLNRDTAHVSLRFRHAMTCLRINISPDYKIKLMNITLADKGGRLYENGTMNIVTRKLNRSTMVPTDTIARDYSVTINAKVKETFHILIPPVENYAAGDFTLLFEFDDKPGEFLRFKVPDTIKDSNGQSVKIDSFDEGRRYTYNLTLKNTVTFEPVEVEDRWAPNEDIEIEL